MFSPARLADLNPPQREAVTTTEGSLLVLAGAGSGKTRVIAYRIAYLLSQGVPASNILAVSFTNKAADEMRERVERLVGSRTAQSLTLCTFHALGLQLLKQEKEILGFSQGFAIYDTADQLGVIREILKDAQVADRRIDTKSVLFRISRLKNAGVSPEAFVKQLQTKSFVSEYDGFAAEIYPRYQQKLKDFHAVDFDDLLVESLRLLRDNEPLRKRWQKRFRYIMVDEYQDTNLCQLELLQILGGLHHNVAVVGDDDQSIYSWRGAVAENILRFHHHFPGAQTIKLEENYRSTQPILDAANAVISKNQHRHGKTLWSQKKHGERIQLIACIDEEEEAKFLTDEMELLKSQYNINPRDIAILYRSNIQARAVEETLRQARVEYKMIGGQAFFDRKEVKDIMAYLSVLVHPWDEVALRRIINYPARGIGSATLEAANRVRIQLRKHDAQASLWDALLALARGAQEETLLASGRGAISKFVDLIQQYRPYAQTPTELSQKAKELFVQAGMQDDLIQSGPTALAAQRRLRNVEQFLESLQRAMRTAKDSDELRTYLHRLSLQSNDDDADDATRNLVTLSTLHGAKGLEFQVVFLIGLEEDLLPHKRTLQPQETDFSEVAGPTDLSEERRLFYVGITRARERLYLTRAKNRGTRAAPRLPSRFLEDIPDLLLHKRDLKEDGNFPTIADTDAFVKQQLAKLFALTKD